MESLRDTLKRMVELEFAQNRTEEEPQRGFAVQKELRWRRPRHGMRMKQDDFRYSRRDPKTGEVRPDLHIQDTPRVIIPNAVPLGTPAIGREDTEMFQHLLRLLREKGTEI